MDKSQYALALLGSAVVGALVSSLVVAFGQWRERIARRKELLLTFAVDLSKVYMARVTKLTSTATVLEITIVPELHKMLTEVFETGEFSDEHQKFIKNHLDVLKALVKEQTANTAHALRESRESQG